MSKIVGATLIVIALAALLYMAPDPSCGFKSRHRAEITLHLLGGRQTETEIFCAYPFEIPGVINSIEATLQENDPLRICSEMDNDIERLGCLMVLASCR